MRLEGSSDAALHPLSEVAALIRSKNAGPFLLTFDIMFDDPSVYRRVIASGVITRALFAQLYGVTEDEVSLFHYDPGLAIKATIPRPAVSGDLSDSDVFGGQLYAPLCDVLVPVGRLSGDPADLGGSQ